jgi:AcrR family transcriptional regulator
MDKVLDTKREAILRAAWERIREKGYAKTSIEEIARRAGIGKGTVYLYFRSKAEIMLALVDLTNERIMGDLEKLASQKSPAENRLRECLLHRIMAIHDLVHRYPHGEEVITSMKSAIVQGIEGHLAQQGKLLADILREGAESGELEVSDPDMMGSILAELFEHFTPPYYRFRSRESLESFANGVIALALKGLKSEPRFATHPRERRATPLHAATPAGREAPAAKTTSREQEIRCLNCFARFTPEQGTDRAFCPQCRVEWRLSWLTPESPKIRGPVWEKTPGRS